MPIFLFLIFVVLPIAEIAVFIEAGQLIGFWPTVALTLGSAFLGSFLVRVQGVAMLNRFVQSAERGEMPIEPVIDGMGILTAGILLATPGFVTDFIGLLLFIPPLRRLFIKALFQRFLTGAHIKFHTFGTTTTSEPPRPHPQSGKLHKSDNVIDAEFETIDPPSGKKPNDGSPWRKD